MKYGICKIRILELRIEEINVNKTIAVTYVTYAVVKRKSVVRRFDLHDATDVIG